MIRLFHDGRECAALVSDRMLPACKDVIAPTRGSRSDLTYVPRPIRGTDTVDAPFRLDCTWAKIPDGAHRHRLQHPAFWNRHARRHGAHSAVRDGEKSGAHGA